MAMPPFAIVRVNPPGFGHAGIFSEVTETLHHGLTELGCDSVLVENTVFEGRINVIFSGHMLHHIGNFTWPTHTVLFNLEPLRAEIFARVPHYSHLLCDRRVSMVWDYDRKNLPVLETLGVQRSQVIPIGYAPAMTRIPAAPQRDIDVLFYGSLTERRKALQQQLESRGLSTTFAFGVYGAARDALIARAKVVLNLSQFEHGGIFDIVRLSYLLSNRACIVAESGFDAEQESEFSEGVAFAPYEDLAAECAYFCKVEAEREGLTQRGFAFFTRRRQSEYLRTPVRALAQLLRL